MKLLERISIAPDVCDGEPTIRGMRIRVSEILNRLSAGRSVAEVLAEYPALEEQDIRQAMQYAAWLTADRLHLVEPLEVDYFVSKLAHDAGYSLLFIHDLASYLANDETGLTPQGKEAASRLTDLTADLERDYRLMHYLVVRRYGILCDFVEDILQPAVLLAQRLRHLSLPRLTAGPTARSAPRVYVVMPDVLQGIARLLVDHRPSRVLCTAESHHEHVLFRLRFQEGKSWMATREQRMASRILHSEGVIAGEEPPDESLTLRFKR